MNNKIIILINKNNNNNNKKIHKIIIKTLIKKIKLTKIFKHKLKIKMKIKKTNKIYKIHNNNKKKKIKKIYKQKMIMIMINFLINRINLNNNKKKKIFKMKIIMMKLQKFYRLQKQILDLNQIIIVQIVKKC